eukprot:gene11436-9936_t
MAMWGSPSSDSVLVDGSVSSPGESATSSSGMAASSGASGFTTSSTSSGLPSSPGWDTSVPSPHRMTQDFHRRCDTEDEVRTLRRRLQQMVDKYQ